MMSSLFRRLDDQTQVILKALIQSERSTLHEIRWSTAQLMSRHEISTHESYRQTRDSIAKYWTYPEEQPKSPPSIAARVEMFTVAQPDEDKVYKVVQTSILKSLQYPAMSNRYESLTEAHPDTFEWALSNSGHGQLAETNLATWLRTGSGIYWISGKPGSGKSTLMKCLFEDKRFYEHLRHWERSTGTADAPLRIATFFFWNSGTTEQRSQSGMLRSLLFQLLEQQPDLMPIAFPEIWASQYTKALSDPNALTLWSTPWTLGCLTRAFIDVFSQNIIKIKICLLVDGLDEFDGDHEVLADLFTKASKSPNGSHDIKICLASRPWIVYRENFEHGPTLQLQNHTSKDIELYVVDKLNANVPFQRLAGRDGDTARDLANEIVLKADGVFIWVHIVVRNLLMAVRNRDSIPDLWKKLKELPSDIEPLYAHIRSQIDPAYLPWSSKILQIIRARLELGSTLAAKSFTGDYLTAPYACAKDDSNGGCLSLGDVYLALDGSEDPSMIGNMSQDQLENNCKETEFHIAARCACLLEIRVSKGSGQITSKSLVQYLHRTARDFIETPSQWSGVLEYTKETAFDPYWSLMRCQSLGLRRLSVEKDYFVDFPEDEELVDAATRILVFASYADAHTISHSEQSEILDDTANTLARHKVQLVDWPEPLTEMGLPPELATVFVRVALALNLSGYISRKLRRIRRQDLAKAKLSASYLLSQIDGIQFRAIAGLPHMSLGMVQMLIASGADVNYKPALSRVERLFKKTSWQHFLERNIPEFKERGGGGSETLQGRNISPDLVPLIELFLSAEADPNVTIEDGDNASSLPTHITLPDYLRKYVRPVSPSKAKSIMRQIDEMEKARKSSQGNKNDISNPTGRLSSTGLSLALKSDGSRPWPNWRPKSSRLRKILGNMK